MKTYIENVEQPHIVELEQNKANNKMKDCTRCTVCGYIAYKDFNEFDLRPCPKCHSKHSMVASFEAPHEAINLLCEAMRITPMSPAGQKVKQAIECLCNYL